MEPLVAATSTVGRYVAGLSLCLPIIGYGVYVFRRVLLMREWQNTGGTILSFDQKFTSYGGQALIRYSYSVDGKQYEGTSISFADWLVAQGAWQVHQLSKRFGAGTVTAVYFDALHPERSVLYRPSYLWPLGILAFGIGAAVYFFWFINTGQTMPPEWRPTVR